MARRIGWNVACVGLCVLVAGLGRTRADDVPGPHDPALFDVVMDAQTVQVGRTPHGAITYRAVFTLNAMGEKPQREAEIAGRVVWRDDRYFWTYRVRNPTGLNGEGSGGSDEPVETQPISYRVEADGVLMAYTPYNNVLGMIPKQAGSYLFSVMPDRGWYICLPTNQPGGRPWSEMIGPNSPALSEGSKLTIRRSDGEKIVQLREDPSGFLVEITFSLNACGNVTSLRSGMNLDRPSQEAEYTWRSLEDGRCALVKVRTANAGEPAKNRPGYAYELEIQEFDPDYLPPLETFSVASMLERVPRDTLVLDRRSKDQAQWQKYRIDGSDPSLRPDRKDFKETIKAEGFLKRP